MESHFQHNVEYSKKLLHPFFFEGAHFGKFPKIFLHYQNILRHLGIMCPRGTLFVTMSPEKSVKPNVCISLKLPTRSFTCTFKPALTGQASTSDASFYVSIYLSICF